MIGGFGRFARPKPLIWAAWVAVEEDQNREVVIRPVSRWDIRGGGARGEVGRCAGQIDLDEGGAGMGGGELVIVHFLRHWARVKGTDVWIGLIFHIDEPDGGQEGKYSHHNRDHLGLAEECGQGNHCGKIDVPGYFPVPEEQPRDGAEDEGEKYRPDFLLGDNDDRRYHQDEEEYDAVDGLGQRQVHKEVHTEKS